MHLLLKYLGQDINFTGICNGTEYLTAGDNFFCGGGGGGIKFYVENTQVTASYITEILRHLKYDIQ